MDKNLLFYSNHCQYSQKLIKILSNNTGKSIKTIENDTNRDNFMSAEKALEYGLIDQIVTSR